MDVMNGRSVRWSRKRIPARWMRFPTVITLPGARPRERHAYLFWRVRLPLWLVPAAAGWLALSWPGIALGLAAGILAELIFSYRVPYGSSRPPTPWPTWGPDGPPGVREPRRPHPAGDAEAAQLPIEPRPPGMD